VFLEFTAQLYSLLNMPQAHSYKHYTLYNGESVCFALPPAPPQKKFYFKTEWKCVTKNEGLYNFLYLTRGDIHLIADKIRTLNNE